MIVFIKEKLAFLAMPKTGTTAIEQALDPWADIVFRNPPGAKHTNVQRFNRFYRKVFESHTDGPIETVSIIRHPLDWLGSWYRYRSRPQLTGHPNSTAEVSFDTFVTAYLSNDRPVWAKVGDQARFLTANPDTAPVTHLFQYEQMDLVVAFLSDRLGKDITLPQVNVSPRMPLDLSPDIDAKLRRKCADQFDLWDAARR